MNALGSLDWAICLSYLGVVVGLGLWFSRQQETNDDYFLGGRSMPWLPVGLSLFATTFSSNSFVGLPAEAAFRDYHLLLAIFFIPLVVIPLTCVYFMPFYRWLKINSIYEYLELRFHRVIRLLASLVFMLYSAGWMGNMLVAVGKILQVVLQINEAQVYLVLVAVGAVATAYTAVGGVRAVIWTDTLQAFALAGGMVFLLALLVGKIDGGWSGLFTTAAEADKLAMFRTRGGVYERNLFSACAFGFFAYLGGQIGTYTAVQRYISVPSASAARRALVVKAIFTPIACTLFFVVGSALYVFYIQSDPGVYNELTDQLLPHFVVNYAGGYGMTGLLLAGLFAAAMSSMDSGINSMTATVVTDWMRGKEIGATANRIWTCVFGATAVGLACVIQTIDMPVFSILMSIAGALLGVLLSVLILGMLIPRANTAAAVSAFVFGAAGYQTSRWMQLETWWDGAFTSSFAFVGGLVVMMVTPPPAAKQTQGLLLRDLPRGFQD